MTVEGYPPDLPVEIAGNAWFLFWTVGLIQTRHNGSIDTSNKIMFLLDLT